MSKKYLYFRDFNRENFLKKLGFPCKEYIYRRLSFEKARIAIPKNKNDGRFFIIRPSYKFHV